jgi:hypothetical protein
MRLFSLYDLPNGNDRAAFLTDLPESLGISGANVRFFGRGESTEMATIDGVEMLVIVQGRCRILVNDVEHLITRFDVLTLLPGERYRVVADEIDPPVVMTIRLPRKAG